jgi:hypothetical protein
MKFMLMMAVISEYYIARSNGDTERSGHFLIFIEFLAAYQPVRIAVGIPAGL